MKYTSQGIELNGQLIPLDVIQKECMRAKVSEGNLALLHYKWANGMRYAPDVEEIIALERSKAEIVLNDILSRDFEAYYSDLGGKHSHGGHTVSSDHLYLETDEESVIKFLLKYPSGVMYDHNDNCFFGKFLDHLSDMEIGCGAKEILKVHLIYR